MSGEIATINAELATENARLEAERDRLEKLIARHQKKLDSLTRLTPGDHLARIFDAVCKTMPGTEYELSGPFGLGGERGVRIKREPGESAFIQFRAGEYPFAVLIDLESDDGSPANTLARQNGLHRRSMPVPDDLSAIVEMVENQFAESRLRYVCGCQTPE